MPGRLASQAATVALSRSGSTSTGLGVHVDQDRAVAVAAAQREIVDTQHAQLWDLRIRLGADEREQQISAGRHAQRRGQAGSCPSGE
jgi:hypothetical protein